MGVPRPVQDRSFGALNIHRPQPHDWDDEEIAAARILAKTASGYVIHAGKLQRRRTGRVSPSDTAALRRLFAEHR